MAELPAMAVAIMLPTRAMMMREQMNCRIVSWGGSGGSMGVGICMEEADVVG